MTGNPKRWVPAAVVVLAVAVLSVAARRPGSLDNGTADGLWKDLRPAAALLTVITLVVVAATFAKHRDDGFGVLRRAGTATALLLVASAVLTPLGLLFFGREGVAPPPDEPGNGPVSMTTTPTTDRHRQIVEHHGPTRYLGMAEWVGHVVLGLVLAAAAVLIGYVIYRLVRRRWFLRAEVPVLEFEELEDADLEQLADAVAAGSQALAYQGHAREAVIACYAAMEDALSAGGNGRRATDTPEDFLRRVTGAQLIPAAPARRLTDLFREARFSRHPIDEAKRSEAREALDAISEHLRARAAAAAATLAARTATAATAAAGPGPTTAASPSSSSGGPR